MSTRYVWSKWNVDRRLVQWITSTGTKYQSGQQRSIYYSSNITSNGSNIQLLNPTEKVINESGYSYNVPYGSYFIIDISGKSGSVTAPIAYYALYSLTVSSSFDISSKIVTLSFNYSIPVYQYFINKGSTSYGNVSSANSGTYPANSYSGDYWYVSLGSDTIDPTALSYTDPVKAGGTVNLTITPSSGIVHGGTVTYTIQTTTNGEDYYDAGATTGTTFAVTVPEDAAIWNVRVYAKDDTGFTSSTYVYGNNIDTWVTVIQSEIVPASGDLGYLTSKNIVAVGVTHVSEQTYSISATLNGEPCFEKSGVAITDATYIILEDETWESIPQETEQALDVTITFTSSTDTRNYTFKKFTYDDTSLEGVMEGMARAVRIKREYETQILGKNMPKEIIKVDNPVNTSGLKEATASEAQVFKGYTFFAGDSELRMGEALSTPISAVESDVKSGKTYYDDNGVLKTGTRSEEPYLLLSGTSPISGTSVTYNKVTIDIPEGTVYVLLGLFSGSEKTIPAVATRLNSIYTTGIPSYPNGFVSVSTDSGSEMNCGIVGNQLVAVNRSYISEGSYFEYKAYGYE